MTGSRNLEVRDGRPRNLLAPINNGTTTGYARRFGKEETKNPS